MIRTIQEFRAAVNEGALVVVTDKERRHKRVVHRFPCHFVTEAHFIEKVLDNGGLHGAYIVVPNLQAAGDAHPCSKCAPGRGR